MSKISFKKLKLYKQKHGTLRLVKKIISRICSFVFSYRPLYIYGIEGVPETAAKARCPLEIREGGPENIELMVKMLKYMDEAAARKRERYLFDNGGKVFLALSDGNLVHIGWLFCSVEVHEPGFSVKIKKDESYISSCDTHPKFRGKNIYPVVLQHIIKHAIRENKKRCFIATIPRNFASIRGIEKAGFSFVGKMRMFKLFGKFFNNQWDSSGIVEANRTDPCPKLK